ncbi:MAG: hypothetical protein KGS09_00510 [Nitrospirae bacterium]|nr:hypothetical protein [Nitrospirota bacterium]
MVRSPLLIAQELLIHNGGDFTPAVGEEQAWAWCQSAEDRRKEDMV